MFFQNFTASFCKWVAGFQSHSGGRYENLSNKTLLDTDDEDENSDDSASTSSMMAFPDIELPPKTGETDSITIHQFNKHLLNVTKNRTELVDRLMGSKIYEMDVEIPKNGVFLTVGGLPHNRLRAVALQLLDPTIEPKEYGLNTPDCIKEIVCAVQSKGATACFTIQEKNGKTFYLRVE